MLLHLYNAQRMSQYIVKYATFFEAGSELWTDVEKLSTAGLVRRE
jgi:hypothetical protein